VGEGLHPHYFMSDAFSEDTFSKGGPLADLQERIRRSRPRWSQIESAVTLVLLTWAPPVILSAFQGPEYARAFLENPSNQYRLLLAGPIAILIEPLVGQVLSRAARHFVEAGVVPDQEAGRYQLLLKDIRRLRESAAPEILLMAGTYLLTIWLAGGMGGHAHFQPMERFAKSSPAWIWYAWVSRPILFFLLLRWLWRIAIWSYFLWRCSRLSLDLSAAHPDHSCGLGFLAQAHASFGLVALPFGIVWAAGWRERFHGGVANADSLKQMIPAFAVVLAVALLGPLLVFSPKIFRTRQRAMLSYGTLASEYCRRFENRWINHGTSVAEDLLGSPDIQSFADLQNTMGAVRATWFVPFDLAAAVAIALGIALPLLPLLTLILPLEEIVRRALAPFF
jgi:hypothetical protein